MPDSRAIASNEKTGNFPVGFLISPNQLLLIFTHSMQVVPKARLKFLSRGIPGTIVSHDA